MLAIQIASSLTVYWLMWVHVRWAQCSQCCSGVYFRQWFQYPALLKQGLWMESSSAITDSGHIVWISFTDQTTLCIW